ncbi:type II toxin-antitoxin system VapC family toxin [Candidatus Woesearchaeota archaeon]|nr:type II toxin-antitoxin system VapC family toxin [Candidatus Woesearchaeota archaeon]
MTSTIKFIDANIFILRWSNPRIKEFIDSLSAEEHCTSVLVLAEVYHKLMQKNVENVFNYIRGIMGTITIYDFTQEELFDAMKNPLDIGMNDKTHIAVMKNSNINTIISFDKDFDRDKTIRREEL